MERNDDVYDELIDRYLKGEATEDEVLLVNSYFNKAAADRPNPGCAKDLLTRKNRVWKNIVRSSSRRNTFLKKYYITIAAAAAAVVIVGVWLFYFSPSGEKGVASGIVQQDIAPGGLGATLTMADGRQIALDSTKKGAVIGTTITYEDGSPVLGGDRDLSIAAEQLTASTGKGQVYAFVLPDGTKVWLNADSKLSFPAYFGSRARKVVLQGEAFFVVKHNDKKRFFVESKGQLVEDLGTSFNIRVYADDEVHQTTLVEGSAKVNAVELLPGQQAVRSTSSPIKVLEADVDQVLGWQQGNFVFRGETLEEVFRVVARWYDVEVVFKREEAKYITVGGTIARSRSIRAVLDLMERTGKVKCVIEGKRINIH